MPTDRLTADREDRNVKGLDLVLGYYSPHMGHLFIGFDAGGLLHVPDPFSFTFIASVFPGSPQVQNTIG